MKRLIKTSLITTIAMLILAGAAIAGLYRLSSSSRQQDNQQALRELDFVNSANKKIEITEHAAKTISGDSGNLKQFNEQKTDTIYTTAYSDKVMKQLDKWKKREKYTLENPLFAENPFGTNSLGLYFYMETPEKSYLSYTVQVEDDNVANFNRTIYEDTPDNMALSHEHQIIGLVPGKVNYIIIEEHIGDGRVKNTVMFKIDLTGHTLSQYAALSNEGIDSSNLPERGLFAIAGREFIYFYDNSGTLRAAIPTKENASSHLEELEKELLISYDSGKYASISGIGRVTGVVKLSKNYIDEGEYVYNGYGQIWLIASEKKGKTRKDQIVSLDLKSGKTKQLIDMKKLWKNVYQRNKGKNWIELNSIALSGSSDVIVNSDKLSALVKISGITGYTPKIQYVIADPDAGFTSISSVKKILYAKSFLENGEWAKEDDEDTQTNRTGAETNDAGAGSVSDADASDAAAKKNFALPYHVRSVARIDDSSLSEGQYYLTFYTEMRNADKKAKFYQLLVDEGAGKYALTEDADIPYSDTYASVQSLKQNRVVFSNSGKELSEFDKSGYRIQSFHLSGLPIEKLTECRKFTMDQIWFQ